MADEPALFTEHLVELADIAKALSHPGRLRILEILAQEESCICGDIVERLPFSQSTVSQHLRALKRVGLIVGEVSGPRTCYGLDQEALLRAQNRFTALFVGVGCCSENTTTGETYEL